MILFLKHVLKKRKNSRLIYSQKNSRIDKTWYYSRSLNFGTVRMGNIPFEVTK